MIMRVATGRDQAIFAAKPTASLPRHRVRRATARTGIGHAGSNAPTRSDSPAIRPHRRLPAHHASISMRASAMDRRQFGLAMAALGLTANAQAERAVPDRSPAALTKRLDAQQPAPARPPLPPRLPAPHPQPAPRPAPSEATLARNQWPAPVAQRRLHLPSLLPLHRPRGPRHRRRQRRAHPWRRGWPQPPPSPPGDLLVLPAGTGHFLFRSPPRLPRRRRLPRRPDLGHLPRRPNPRGPQPQCAPSPSPKATPSQAKPVNSPPRLDVALMAPLMRKRPTALLGPAERKESHAARRRAA